VAGGIQLDPERYPFQRLEDELREAAERDFGEPLELAETLVGYLADSAHHSELRAGDISDASHARQAVLLALSGMGVRTARALILLIRSGWEPEAHALKRRLSEIVWCAQWVLDDPSGEAARQWLEGRGRSAARLARAYGGERPWDLFSSGAHADPRSLRLSMSPPPWVDVPNAERSLDVRPGRVVQHGEGLLLETAWESGMLMVGLAEAFGRPVLFAGDEMERLTAARERYAERSAVFRASRGTR